MSLLNDLFAKPLDPGYEEVAKRRAKAGADTEQRDPRSRFSPAMVLGMIALGLLLTAAALQVRDSAPVITAERESLIERVHDQDDRVASLSQDLSALEGEVAALESTYLEDSSVGQAVGNELDRVESIVGQDAVTGPGVVVTLNDAEQLTGESTELVLATDLQHVVNGFWAAGAEAVAINGERITSLTSIRSVDRVPQVNYRPIASPYRVVAIGDGNRLATRFGDGSGGTWLRYMADAGPTYKISLDEEVTLPSANTAIEYALPQEVS